MAQLADALASVRLNEIAQAESLITSHLAALLPPVSELDEETQRHLPPFINWCASANVRHAPAAPAICAAFFLNQARVGVAPERIAAEARAIELLHDHYGLANPIQTRAARWALDRVLPAVEPPRSWTKDEKEEFSTFPRSAQEKIARREKDRETTLRRGQNSIAEMRKRLQEQMPESKSAEPKEENEMGKKKEGHELGVGEFSKNDVTMTRQPAKFDPGRDISKTVERNADQDAGFSGKLTSGE